MTTSVPLRIGTRASLLARTQTGWVAERLRAHGIEVSIEVIGTRGDERRDVPIAAIGGDGVFVRELEQALLDGRIDAAVHSLKDMPTAETAGLVLAGIPVRATPFDALVGRTSGRLEDLPAGARIGTSSIRRVVQLKAVRPDVRSGPWHSAHRDSTGPCPVSRSMANSSEMSSAPTGESSPLQPDSRVTVACATSKSSGWGSASAVRASSSSATCKPPNTAVRLVPTRKRLSRLASVSRSSPPDDLRRTST
jgi:hypothetical protein